MATSKECLSRASRELGYCRWDDPQAGTKYGRWYAELTKSPYFGTSGIPFCAMGVSYIMDAVKQACAGLPTAGVPTIYSGASRAGIIIPNKRSAVPGDIVIFDWSNVAGPNDHVGFVEINMGSTGLQTIEFNTTGSDGRSGSVARKLPLTGTSSSASCARRGRGARRAASRTTSLASSLRTATGGARRRLRSNTTSGRPSTASCPATAPTGSPATPVSERAGSGALALRARSS